MKLHNQILFGLLLGAASGVAVHVFAPGAEWARWTVDNVASPMGQIFLRMLLMTVVPLVFASITLGVAGVGDVRQLGRLGGKTVAYFLLSTALSVVLGLALVNALRPGAGMDPETRAALFESYRSQTEGLAAGDARFGIQTLVNVVPRNPVRAAADGDMLAVIFFALMFGAALTTMPNERAAPMLRFVEALGDVVAKIIDFAMRLAPVGVFGLIFAVTSRFGWELLGQLGLYVAVVIGGLAIHAAVTLSAMVRTLGGLGPLRFWKRVRACLVTAFSTSSSNATLPTTIAVAERELEIAPRVAGFVLPLGATMNMNGTALYEGVTVLFLAQVFGIELAWSQQLVVFILSVVTAIGAAGVPGGSLPLIMMVLASVGVPPESIAIILGVDRLLDMCRTTVNVAGDLTAALYVARSEGGAGA